MAKPARDKWAEWLLERRHGGGEEDLRATLNFLHPIRERVLRNAGVSHGETLLDVEAGDGLIAFGALELVGAGGQVIFSDIYRDLLDHARSIVEEMGVADRRSFLRASARDLSTLNVKARNLFARREVGGSPEAGR